MEKKVNQKEAPSVSFFSVLSALKNPYFTARDLPKNFSEVAKFNSFSMKLLIVNDPEFIKEIVQAKYKNFLKGDTYDTLALLFGNGLLTSEGENWKKQRKMIQPAFHMRCLEQISELVTEETNEMLGRWKNKKKSPVNLTQEMAELTIKIICRSLFTTDLKNDDIQGIWENMNFLNVVFGKITKAKVFLPRWIPVKINKKTKKAINKLNNIVDRMIDKRQQETSTKTDLLQLLLDARYEDTNTGMTKEQVREEIMTLLVAGHETTVNALSWTWYLLLQHPAELEKLKEESIPLSQTGSPTFVDLREMKIGKQMMNESMRIFPPIIGVGRTSTENDHVLGYEIAPKTHAVINIVGAHHHPAYWKEPEKFKPERFENFEAKGMNRFRFMPFGAGPRICIGNNFAMMEMQLINAMLASRVELELVSREITPIATTTLKPGNGVMIKIKKFHD